MSETFIESLRKYSEVQEEDVITFEEFLERVKENPKLARFAHQYIYDMVLFKGKEKKKLPTGEEVPVYRFFDEEIWGIEKSIEEIMKYFRGAAYGSDLHKRILLLVGPPGSGKSSIIILLKKGLEWYSKTAEGAIYALKGCPIQESPLHLVPEEMRKEFKKEYGFEIEGELCPVCHYRLKHEYNGKFLEFPVERFYFSEQDRVGIGTFLAGDPLTQDQTSLVGTINLARLPKYGSETHPLVYDFRAGEAFVAHRGLLELMEGLKAKTEILYSLLTLAQEKNVKTERFPLVYVDTVIVIHTNVEEFQRFLEKKENKALKDRFYIIKVPYNLRYNEEERIYKKLLLSSFTGDYHFAPHSLQVAAMFAIMTRIHESENQQVKLFDKLRLYNGDEVEGYTERDIENLSKEGEKNGEGMDGLSPRFIVNALSGAVAKKDTKCLTPIDVFRELKVAVEKKPDLSDSQKERYIEFLQEILKYYNHLAITDVQRAFYISFESEINALFKTYLDNVEAYLNNTKLRDPVTDQEMDPDESLMSSIESLAGVPDSAKKEFREEIMRKVASSLLRGKTFDITSIPKLKEGLEKQLFQERAPIIRATLTSRSLTEEEIKRRDQVMKTMIDKYGYCVHCSQEVLKYVSNILARET